MPTLPEEGGCWLYGNSINGVPLRDDVCAAANAIWRTACRRTRRAMGDSTETAAVMELAAGQASSYLERAGKKAVSLNVPGILMRIFCRLLSKRARPSRKLEPVGRDVELEQLLPALRWEEDVIRQLVIEKLKRHMSSVGVTILSRRLEGCRWDEIAAMLKTSVPTVKTRFWREIEHAKARLRIGAQTKPGEGRKAS